MQPRSNEQNKAESFSGYSSVNGLNMYYEIHGAGKPLVLIHGGGSTIETSFGKILPVLAQTRQVIAVELQSHGHTEDKDRPYSFEQDADDVAALLTNIKIDKADVFGFSNGGNTAMQLAIRHPSLVDKLILASSFYKRAGMHPQFWEFMNNASFADMPQQLKDAYIKVAPFKEDLIKMHDKDLKRMLTFKDWKDEDIKMINALTLVMLGDKDVVRPEHAIEMVHLLPHSRLAILPGTHGEFIGEIAAAKAGSKVPELAVSLILEFLADTPEVK